MKTILIATEANEGMGHIAPWFGLAATALEQGYTVHMAAPDVGVLNSLVGDHLAVGLWQSPILSAPLVNDAHASALPPKSWPELLVSLGYAQPVQLQGAVKAWCNLLQSIRPDVVVADYAPALLLAAHALGIPTIEAGGGFCVPPWSPHVQPFPGVQPQDRTHLNAADATLARAFSQCLANYGKPGIESLAAMQHWPALRVVLSPSELDHYGQREGVLYAGLMTAAKPARLATAAPLRLHPDHPAHSQHHYPRVLGYLKATTPGLNLIIGQLTQAQVPALIYIAGSGPWQAGLQGSVHLIDQPIDLAAGLAHADIYLSNGGISGLGLALQHGAWPVVVPQQAEQVAMARNLVQRGWGALWLPGGKHGDSVSADALFARRPRVSRCATNGNAEAKLLGWMREVCARAIARERLTNA